MNLRKFPFALVLWFFIFGNVAIAQVDKSNTLLEDIEISPYDFGKMWTFENLPLDYFEKTYGFRPTEKWIESARMSSLRFASWCSASFVSPNGLIMTNHHCSRDVVTALQKEGESFEKNGFVAQSFAEERKADELFVEQLVQVADITAMVKKYTDKAQSDAEVLQLRQEGLEAVKKEFENKSDWKDLRLQTVVYYSGGKFSLYGYKKFSDIRLVMIPEGDLGYFGGDPDNFTYPRYNLDCTFWRAYGDDGKPLNTSMNYFKFNADGVQEGNPVFVIGNPGSTERYRTVAQLEYDRDYRFPIRLRMMSNTDKMLRAQYEKEPSEELMNRIFGNSNGLKAFTGILKGLNDPMLFGKKEKMEMKIRGANPGLDYWDKLSESYEALGKLSPSLMLMNPGRRDPTAPSASLQLMFAVYDYTQQIKNDASDEEMDKAKEAIKEGIEKVDSPEERAMFAMLLADYDEFSPDRPLKGSDAQSFVDNLFQKSNLLKGKKLKKALKPKKFKKSKDPFVVLSNAMAGRFNRAVESFQSTAPMRRNLESKVANAVFNVYGANLPPDATFTLRMADGVVKSYEYNGTTAPIKTTYFGMYDRYYSNNGKFPWSLPEKWMNPPMDLLKAPLNFVSTNDIIGGNSGSPMINQNLEAIGLIFDGNIESLPGNFIFDDEVNRTVSVHAGGILAAIKYIYKADKLYDELTGR
ncbi:MAG: S46 family peptidase [Bacteroidota bacterium]